MSPYTLDQLTTAWMKRRRSVPAAMPGLTHDKGPTRIVWKAPQVVIDNHCVQNSVQDSPEKYGCRTDVNYPQFFEYNGRYFITYCNRKLDILINEIDPALLDDFGLPC